MKSNHSAYNHLASVGRIDEILAGAEAQYEEVASIPAREKLTFTNGYYVDCSALFIDVRGSSALPEKYKQKTLAKLYRSYISEAVAVINGNPTCAEIMIVGDAVSAVFDTPDEARVNGVLDTVAELNSLVQIINCRLKRNAIDPIRAGIGVSWGRALMIKAGNRGSTVNDVVWMGHVVNRASKLCSLGSKEPSDPPIVVDTPFRDRLRDDYKTFLQNTGKGYYTALVFNKQMEAWRKENCR